MPQTMLVEFTGHVHNDVMLVVVACQGGVVGFNVQLVVFIEVVRLEETDARLSVVVILVLHWFTRLGLN